MEHLPVHLVDEIKLGGLNHLRWMYSTERKLCMLKGLVRNRCRSEASIVEGCDAEDCLTFSSTYLHDGVKTRFSRYQIEEDEDVEQEGDSLSPILPNTGHPIGGGSREKKKNFYHGYTVIF